MIQFKRGKSNSWYNQKTPLADGQPGYDKDRNKLKIGNGKDSWENLPDVSGLRMDEILVSEEDAKKRNNGSLSLLALIKKVLKRSGRPIFTYGTTAPDENIVGQIYLQYYDTQPETDYVVSSGTDGIWKYHKWKSGKYECSGTLEVSTTVQEVLGNLYSDKKVMKSINYPVAFKSIPTEVASIQSPGGIVWLAGRGQNSQKHTATYSIISPSKQNTAAIYKINLYVSGY